MAENEAPNVTAAPVPTPPTDLGVESAQQQPPSMPANLAPPSPPAPPGSFFHNLSHSFVGAVLGNMAMREKTPPQVDSSGTMQPPVMEKATTGDTLRNVARAALMGLAAGSRVPQQKSGIAQGLAGLGAGAEDSITRQKDQGLLERKQATEDYDQKQKTLLQKHEIAKGNVLMLDNYMRAMREQEDHDPERAANLDLAKAAEDAGVDVKYLTKDEALAMQAKDSSLTSSHAIRPIGYKAMMDGEGKPVMNADGSIKSQGRMVFIPGLVDDKVPVPQSFVDGAQKFAKLAGSLHTEDLVAGHPVPLNELLSLERNIQEGRKMVAQGWAKPEIAWTGDKNDKPVAMNPVTGEKRDLSAVPSEALKDKAEIGLKTAQTEEARNKGREALANASLLAGGGVGAGVAQYPQVQAAVAKFPKLQAIIGRYPAEIQNAILNVAAGHQDVKTASNRVKGVINQLQLGGLADAVHMTMTGEHWSESLYDAYKRTMEDFTGGGKDATAIASFNQFMGHAGEAADVVGHFRTTQSPLLNKPINWLRTNMAGDPQVTKLMTALLPVREEYMNFLKNNLALGQDEREKADQILDDKASPDMIFEALRTMTPQAITRLDQINEKYRTANGEDFPNLITPSGKDAAGKLGFAKEVAKYASGGTLSGGEQSGRQATAYKITATGPNGHKIGSNDNQKTWFDVQTGQPIGAK